MRGLRAAVDRFQSTPTLDGPIRANPRIDSRELPDSRESFQGSRTGPLFCESRFVAANIANRGFEAIRANRSHVMKIGVSLRLDSRESPPIRSVFLMYFCHILLVGTCSYSVEGQVFRKVSKT